MNTSPTSPTRWLTCLSAALALLVLTSVLTPVTSAQDLPDKPIKFPLTFGGLGQAKAEPKVTADLYPVQGMLAEMKAGDEVELAVTIDVPPDSYIYSQTTPKGGKTHFTIEETKELEAVTERFVPDRQPKAMFDPDFMGDVEKFTEPVTWTRRYKVAAGADPKIVAVTGRVDYQVCDDATCRTIPADIHAAIGPRPEPKAKPSTKLSGNVRGWKTTETITTGQIEPAKVSVLLFPADAKPGEQVTLAIRVELAEGWHTYSLTQPPKNFAQATVIKISETTNLEPVGEGFRPDRPFESKTLDIAPGITATQEIHEPEVVWLREYVVQPGAAGDGIAVVGAVDLQVCNEAGCVPDDIQFDLGQGEPVALALGGPAGTETAPQEATTESDGESAASGDDLRSKGLLYFIGWAALSGALSLLTPCVYPMIPITISFFLKQAEKEHHRPATLALVYSGAIVVTFTVLGMLIAVLFRPIALTELANSIWLNLLLAGVLIFFGISMLGYFEIAMPSWLLTWSSNKEQRGGLAGTLFMALTFTLVSFTCTFPVAGAVLVWAKQGEFLWPVIGMLTFSVVFAAPFFLLALFPSFLKKMPKSGGWMSTIKATLGLIEIGAALKFLSVAENSWHVPPIIFTFETVMMLWFLTAVVAGLYVLGVIRFSHDDSAKSFTLPRILLAVPFLLLAWRLAYLVGNRDEPQNWVDEQLAAFAPPEFDEEGATGKDPLADAIVQQEIGPFLRHDGLVYALDYKQAQAFAERTGRTLFLDFTGVDCVNCRLMENRMAQPHNRERLEGFVRVQLYTDKMPGVDDPQLAAELLEQNRRLQQEWFGDTTLPAYAVVASGGNEVLSRYKGLEQERGEFAEFLDRGLAAAEQNQTENTEAIRTADIAFPSTR